MEIYRKAKRCVTIRFPTQNDLKLESHVNVIVTKASQKNYRYVSVSIPKIS